VKIYKTSSFASLLFLSSLAVAGGMATIESHKNNITYLSGEWSYTWNGLGTITSNGNISNQSNKGSGGRLSSGLIHHYKEDFYWLGEIGGGFYGSTSYSSDANSTNVNINISGYDISVGGLYSLHDFSIFGTVGFMMQNLHLHTNRDLNLSIPGGAVSGSVDQRITLAETLPELRTGMIYNLYENVAVSISYTHAFGTNDFINSTIHETSGQLSKTSNTNSQNPTLDSIFLGIRYNFS